MLTKAELEIWDTAFAVARKACRDHVSFSHKGDYSFKVAEAFVRSINDAKRKVEKKDKLTPC